MKEDWFTTGPHREAIDLVCPPTFWMMDPFFERPTLLKQRLETLAEVELQAKSNEFLGKASCCGRLNTHQPNTSRTTTSNQCQMAMF